MSWDFSMCDAGPHLYSLELYMARTGMQRNRPTFVGINVDSKSVEAMGKMEDIGLTTFHMKDSGHACWV